MNAKKNDTRMAILTTAQDMIQRQSVSGVSFQDIARKVGIKKGSMYYHFESKDELSVGLLEKYSETLTEKFKQGLSLTPQIRLNNMFIYYRTRMCEKGKLCPGGAFAIEGERLTPPVRKALKNFMLAMKDGIQDIITDGVKTGVFNLQGCTEEEVSLWILSNLQGALTASRALDTTLPFESMEKVIRVFLSAPAD